MVVMTPHDCEENKARVFSVIQQFLQRTPLVIWGSGATVACGLPTMRDLGKHIKRELSLPIDENADFEEQLCKSEFEPRLDDIRKSIWTYINAADLNVRAKITNGGDENINAITLLLKTFCNNHPQTIKVVTTNYDRVLENVSAWNGLSYADGSGLGDLTDFSLTRFEGKINVKIVKVHGSLSWGRFKRGVMPRVSHISTDDVENVIIIPGNNKYKEAYSSPYRELIQMSDEYVKEAVAFLVVGFGFNDMHITPNVSEKIRNGTPVIVVTMQPTKNTRDLITNAKRYIMLTKDDVDPEMTHIEFKEKDSSVVETTALMGKFWSLSGFMEALS